MQQPTMFGLELPPDNRAKLQQKFIVPPFSVLDTRQGYWQERKRAWVSLGIESEIGRGENLLNMSEPIRLRIKQQDSLLFKSLSGGTLNYYTKKEKIEKELGRKLSNTEFEDNYLEVNGVVATGTSIFDPVLCELAYKWFCPEQGLILDPFAGGSVRGIVASVLGYQYYGIDLSQQQVEANMEQGKKITPSNLPHWIVGDSANINSLIPQKDRDGLDFDFIFSCPPYHDLEIYSDDPNDVSNMSWGDFQEKYSEIITKSISRLKYHRFACFVVSEVRNKVGSYKGLVPLTISSFTKKLPVWGAMEYYNDIVLVNIVGSLALRIGAQFTRFRKVGRTHQNVLVFFKGNIEEIPYYFKEIEDNFHGFVEEVDNGE